MLFIQLYEVYSFKIFPDDKYCREETHTPSGTAFFFFFSLSPRTKHNPNQTPPPLSLSGRQILVKANDSHLIIFMHLWCIVICGPPSGVHLHASKSQVEGWEGPQVIRNFPKSTDLIITGTHIKVNAIGENI